MKNQGSSSMPIKNRKSCVVPLIKTRMRHKILKVMSLRFLNYFYYFFLIMSLFTSKIAVAVKFDGRGSMCHPWRAAAYQDC